MEGHAVSFTATTRLFALTLALAAGLAAASAQAAPASGQEPPPVPDHGTTSQPNCIDQKSEYKTSGKNHVYVQTFENKCAARMRCAVFVYQINARGPTQGRTTLILGPKLAGAAAKKSYALKVKGVGGMSTAARECRVF
jgi:hypothetical protein